MMEPGSQSGPWRHTPPAIIETTPSNTIAAKEDYSSFGCIFLDSKRGQPLMLTPRCVPLDLGLAAGILLAPRLPLKAPRVGPVAIVVAAVKCH